MEGRQAHVTPRRPFRDYLQWLATQDQHAAEQHWRGVLGGFDSPTPLPYDRPPAEAHRAESSHSVGVALSAEQSGQLLRVARRNGLTPNTIVQGAWALLLSRYSGEGAGMFGATVSGRPAGRPGAESRAGMSTSAIPGRAPGR